MERSDEHDLSPPARRNIAVLFFGAILDFLNRLGRHWFMLLILLGGVCLAIRGTILLDYGVAYLFRENQQLVGFSPSILLQSPSFFTELLAVMLAGAAWVFAVDLDAPSLPKNALGSQIPKFHRELPSLAIRIVILAIFPLLALLYPSSDAIAPLRNGEGARALLGWLVGLGLSLIVLSVAWLVERGLGSITAGHFGIKGWLDRKAPRIATWIAWDNIIWRVVILWVMYILAWAGNIVVAVQLPAVAIFALVGVALGGYVALNFIVERMRFYVIAAVFALATLLRGGDAYTYRFPGLEAQYAACDRAGGRGAGGKHDAAHPLWCGRGGGSGAGNGGNGNEFRQVPRAASLRGLKSLRLGDSSGAKTKLPKLVVVAISGGAYRAAFWGALVLDKLRAESSVGKPLEGFAEGVRLLSGSSGGMVPAAYFTTLSPEQLPGSPSGTGIEEMIARDIGRANGLKDDEPSYDSLSPIAQQLVQKDLFNTFRPGRALSDRGRTLDEQWGKLNVTFEQQRAEEEAGRRPSLILSPMIAETGQPLLISNLDLTGISGTGAAGAQQTLDLFKALPDAARGLTLATAVRMSATFPLITPSVSLPTIPPLHPLDAGYFDDYGMAVALGYLKQRDVIDWVSANTSGIILVQINAFPTDPLGADAVEAGCADLPHATLDGAILRTLSPIVSPLAGLFSSRGASMVFRNDQELDTLQQLMRKLRAKDGKPLSFEQVVFQNAARASFSWYLPQHDLECMRTQLEAPHNKAALERLAVVWRSGEADAAAVEPAQ